MNANTAWNMGIAMAAVLVLILSVIMGIDAQRAFVGTETAEAHPEFVAHIAPDSVPLEAVEDLAEFEPVLVQSSEEGLVGQTSKKQKKTTLKPAVLQVVANFQKSEVTVNGIPYPSYFEPDQPEGVVLPAGGPYDVRVTHGGKTKAYKVYLKPYETRLLIVEIPGFSGTAPVAAKPAPRAAPKPEEEKKEGADPGKITVYSKPPGTIIIDGKNTGEKTPGTVESENGRHEVQVQYDGGEISEKKIVRVRDGSRIKLFFRERTTP